MVANGSVHILAFGIADKLTSNCRTPVHWFCHDSSGDVRGKIAQTIAGHLMLQNKLLYFFGSDREHKAFYDSFCMILPWLGLDELWQKSQQFRKPGCEWSLRGWVFHLFAWNPTWYFFYTWYFGMLDHINGDLMCWILWLVPFFVV